MGFQLPASVSNTDFKFLTSIIVTNTQNKKVSKNWSPRTKLSPIPLRRIPSQGPKENFEFCQLWAMADIGLTK